MLGRMYDLPENPAALLITDSPISDGLLGVPPASKPAYNQNVKLKVTFRSGLKAAPPCRLRLIVSYPRVGMNCVPSAARPSLFGCD
jgi:hypothetical protein